MSTAPAKPKPKSRKKPARAELQARYGLISQSHVHYSTRIDKPRGLGRHRESEFHIQLFGNFFDALNGTYAFEISLSIDRWSNTNGQIPDSIGSIIQIKHVVQAVVHVDEKAFMALLPLAAANSLRTLYLCHDTPKRGGAKIISFTLNTDPDEAVK
jgi:hypothetical protein